MNDVRKLIVTITLCLCLLLWGTIIVLRRVEDKNYHAPTSAQESVDNYKSCMFPDGSSSKDCAKLLETNK